MNTPLSAAFAQEASTAQTAEQLPISVYGDLPDVEMASLSESGSHVAVLTKVEGIRTILIIENQTELVVSWGVEDMKVRDIEWVGDDAILLVTSQTEDLSARFTTDKAEFFVGRVLSLVDNERSGLIFGNQRNLLDAIVGNYGIREIDGRYYGFYGAIELDRSSSQGFVFDHGRPYLYRVDFQDFSVNRMAGAAAVDEEKDWLIDANGQIAATLQLRTTSGNWRLRGPSGDEIASGTNPLARISLIGLGFDGSTVLLSERDEEGVEWYEVPLAGGERRPFLPGIGIRRLYFDDSTGHLIGYLQRGREDRVVFQDEAYEEKARQVRSAFSTVNMAMRDWTSDLEQVLVRTTGDQDSGTWFMVDIGAQRANAIAYERQAVGPEHVGAVSTFEFTASDGMAMDGILTLPPGREAKNLPVVVLPHGGPHSHDTETFDWWAQAYASRGYAVFQPNFRGSTGRSNAFTQAGFGQWGRKMQSDKSDGLAALAEAGIVDASRACIVGASYGGYAALAGVTLQQDIYRCAVAVAPVSDITDMYQQDYRASGGERTTKAALLDQLGPRNSWNDVSPLRYAEQADAPIMLIHGRDDIVVPFSHSAKMADALDDADKSHEMIALDGEDHWLSRSETRRQMLEAAVRFVEEHNPAD
ncbi:MAG: prolyl oligopeptidase family serine peptidase [Erythrobacter sp.]